MASKNQDIYIVKRPFLVAGRKIVRKGTRLLGSDPIVKGNEHLMVLATEGFDVEQASARPGERRNVTPAPEVKEPTKAELLAEWTPGLAGLDYERLLDRARDRVGARASPADRAPRRSP